MKLENKRSFLLVLILLVALFLRTWGISLGLPNFYHFDEKTTIYTAFFAASNRLQPDHFLNPMLLPYILIFLFGIYFLLGIVLGFWNSTHQFFIAYLRDPTSFLLLGRLFTVFIGVLSVWLVYWIGKKIYQEKIGLVAAFFLALAFLHIQESHFIEEDVLVGFLGLLAFYFNFLIIKKSRLKDYLISGILLGLLFSMKYHFFIFLPMFVLAHFLRVNREKFSLQVFYERKFWLTLTTAIIVFFLLNPYIVFLSGRALKEIGFQARVTTGQWVNSEGQPIWLYYLTYHLRYGLGLPLLVLAISGAFYLVFKTHQDQDFLLVSVLFTFFATLVIFGGPNFARYAVMILPFFALSAAVLMNKLIDSRSLLVFTCFLIILPSFLRIIKFDYYISQVDTRILAKEWIERNIPPGTKIVNEGAMRSEYTSIYGPPLWMDADSITELLTEVKRRGLPGTYLEALLEAGRGKVGYDLEGTIRLDGEYDPVSGKYFSLSGVEKYVAGDYYYLVSSSWAMHNQTDYAPEFKQSLEENYRVINEFIPNPKLRDDLVWEIDFHQLDKVNIFASNVISGPEIKIYQLK